MPLEFKTLTSPDLIPGTFMSKWQFGNHLDERKNTKKASQYALRNQARLHVAQLDGNQLGFVTVSFHKPGDDEKKKKTYDVNCLQVMYLFVSKPYRKTKFDELNDLTVAECLIGYVIEQALQATTFFPLNSIVLQPAHDNLKALYSSFDFINLPGFDYWMFLPLPKPQ